ncbi:inner membrane protein YbjM, partial [Enterobacter asburiae]
QEDSLNIKRNWAGVISCFLLFTVVCLCLPFNLNRPFTGAGHPALGVVFFKQPRAAPPFI